MPLFGGDAFFLKEISDEKYTQDPTAEEKTAVTALFDSVKNGDLSTVQNALDSMRLQWDVVNDCNYTLLTWAAFYGHVDIVNALLDFGFNPKFAPRVMPGVYNAYTAFHAACAGGEGAVIGLLLERNIISINMVEPLFNQTGFQVALRHRSYIVATGLLDLADELKINLSHIDKRRRTPLATALAGFVGVNFVNRIMNTPLLPLLDNICLRLLARENAFNPPGNARPAIQVIFNDDLAYNYPSGHFPADAHTLPYITLCQLMVHSPLVCETLHKQALEQQALEEKAQTKPPVSYANLFLKLYTECELYPDITKDDRARLHSAFSQLTK